MAGVFAHIKEAPIDPILGTTQLYNADKDARKINLGVGAYRSEQGKPFVLQVVKDAESEMLQELGGKLDKEYLPIDGVADLKKVTQELLFGEGAACVKEGRVASLQALSGTGALRVAAAFIHDHLPKSYHEIWVSEPTWGNHDAIFKAAGLTVKKYPYWDAAKKALDFEGMMKALGGLAPGTLVLLHACAHNPTGVDPTTEQWKQIAKLVQEKKLMPIMDSAYQGYASGDLDFDAGPARLFESMGFEMFVCQSFAKNLGLYGERIGMLHIIAASEPSCKAVMSQVKLTIRAMYSSPPKHGAHLVAKILGNPDRKAQWKAELAAMAARIVEVRKMLREGLEAKKTPGTWNHITDQIGMFSYTGLSEEQCDRLTKVHHIYLLKSGRISLAGLNRANVQYMVDCIDEVVNFKSSKL